MKVYDFEPGIYFGMPFEVYCKIPAMNASQIKSELISPMNGWSTSPRNPLRDEQDDETKAKNDGRIYHKLILEGREEFDKVYAPDFEDDPEDKTIIRTVDDIKSALLALGQPVTFKVKDMGITNLLAANPGTKILDVMKAEHRRKYAGREFVPAKFMREVELHNHVIRYNPEFNRWLTGGYPEVTVIWDYQDLGLKCKIRIDYLKLQFPVDLKSFANSKMIQVKHAIRQAIASYKYHIQASLYMHGCAHAKYLVENGCIFSWEPGTPAAADKPATPGRPRPVTDEELRANNNALGTWLDAFPRYPVESFNFIFIQKGAAPVAMGNFIRRGSTLDKLGLAQIQEGVRSHLRTIETFGDDAPLHLAPAEELHMDEMPAYINNV